MIMETWEFKVAIQTGKDYWHVLDASYKTFKEAFMRADKEHFPAAVLLVVAQKTPVDIAEGENDRRDP